MKPTSGSRSSLVPADATPLRSNAALRPSNAALLPSNAAPRPSNAAPRPSNAAFVQTDAVPFQPTSAARVDLVGAANAPLLGTSAVQPMRRADSRLTRTAAAAIVIALGFLAGEPALAESAFGDTQLSYDGGVVYDDDLVPGRGVNTPFLENEGRGAGGRNEGESSGVPGDASAIAPERSRQPGSANLIGPDGRLRN